MVRNGESIEPRQIRKTRRWKSTFLQNHTCFPMNRVFKQAFNTRRFHHSSRCSHRWSSCGPTGHSTSSHYLPRKVRRHGRPLRRCLFAPPPCAPPRSSAHASCGGPDGSHPLDPRWPSQCLRLPDARHPPNSDPPPHITGLKPPRPRFAVGWHHLCFRWRCHPPLGS